MARISCGVTFLSKFVLHLDDRTFVDSRILDELTDTKIPDKSRKLEVIVKSIIQHTELKLEEVVRTIKTSEPVVNAQRGSAKGNVAVAINIMQLVILRGAAFCTLDTKTPGLRFVFLHKQLDTGFQTIRPNNTTCRRKMQCCFRACFVL